jgi:hypothetical protein
MLGDLASKVETSEVSLRNLLDCDEDAPSYNASGILIGDEIGMRDWCEAEVLSHVHVLQGKRSDSHAR